MLPSPNLPAIVEALLVASDDPLPTPEIARLIRARIAELEDELVSEDSDEAASEGSDYGEKIDTKQLPPELKAFAELIDTDVLAAIEDLNRAYQESGRSFLILERAKGWKLFTNPNFGGFVKHLFPGRKPKRLSAPAMETLAVVAYRQPVTKSAIDAVRGVSSDGMLQKLLDLELIKIGGRAELPGRPLLYETTDYFFEHFGIKSPDELPNALELRRMDLPEGEEENGADAVEASGENDSSEIPKAEEQPALAQPSGETEEFDETETVDSDFASPSDSSSD